MRVDDAYERCAIAAGRGRSEGFDRVAPAASLARTPDLGGDLARVRLRREPIPRGLHLGWIAEMLEAIGERAADGLRPDIESGRGVPADGGLRELLEDVQNLQCGD